MRWRLRHLVLSVLLLCFPHLSMVAAEHLCADTGAVRLQFARADFVFCAGRLCPESTLSALDVGASSLRRSSKPSVRSFSFLSLRVFVCVCVRVSVVVFPSTRSFSCCATDTCWAVRQLGGGCACG